MKSKILGNILIAIVISIFLGLIIYESFCKSTLIEENIIVDQDDNQNKVVEKVKDNELKEIELSREDAYEEIKLYNKIYHWKYMYIKDENYEPAKKYEYKNPELRISSNTIILNSDIYDISDYKVMKHYINNELIRVVIKYNLSIGEASFHHNLKHEKYPLILKWGAEYYFELIDNTSFINIYCADRVPTHFHS